MFQSQEIRRAADLLLKGALVAFPTETVYGLGALATNERAVRRIYQVKGRPLGHPLIVHSANREEALDLVRELSVEARRLADLFWPGPLTLILPKTRRIPDLVTGGQDLVGIRVPAHPLAQALLYQVGQPVAAPSANRFGRVSPTSAEHVRRDLGSRVDFILDGGPCRVGVESTIVAFRTGAVQILRPGGVSREAIEAALGRKVELPEQAGLRVSGALASHYAPRARVLTASGAAFQRLLRRSKDSVHRVIVLRGSALSAERLYDSLRRADDAGADLILAELPSERGLGLAVADRLRKASTR